MDWDLVREWTNVAAAAVAAFAAMSVAAFTFLLWRAAKDELGLVLEASRAGATAREAEVAELRAQRESLEEQVRVASRTLQAQLLPVPIAVISEVPYVEKWRDASFVLGNRRFEVTVENVGPGPALETGISIWIEMNPSGRLWEGIDEPLVFQRQPQLWAASFVVPPGGTVSPRLSYLSEVEFRSGQRVQIFWRTEALSAIGEPTPLYQWSVISLTI